MEKKPDRSEIITMTLLFALTLVLTVLKVTREVSLPWLWVLGPLWLGTYRYRDLGCLRWEISPSFFYSSEMPRFDCSGIVLLAVHGKELFTAFSRSEPRW